MVFQFESSKGFKKAGNQLRHTGVLSDRRPNRPSYKDPNLHRIILCLQIDRREYLKGHWIYIIQIDSLLLVEGWFGSRIPGILTLPLPDGTQSMKPYQQFKQFQQLPGKSLYQRDDRLCRSCSTWEAVVQHFHNTLDLYLKDIDLCFEAGT